MDLMLIVTGKRFLQGKQKDKTAAKKQRMGETAVNVTKKYADPMQFSNVSYEEKKMNFKDWFVPGYLHSNPEVRMKFVKNSSDARIIKQVSEKDSDPLVRKAALERGEMLKGKQPPAS